MVHVFKIAVKEWPFPQWQDEYVKLKKPVLVLQTNDQFLCDVGVWIRFSYSKTSRQKIYTSRGNFKNNPWNSILITKIFQILFYKWIQLQPSKEIFF